MLGEAEVAHCDRHITPAARAHDRADVVAIREEVLRGAHPQGVPRNLRLPRPRAPRAHDGALHDLADGAPADAAVQAGAVVHGAEEPGYVPGFPPEPPPQELGAALGAEDEAPAAVGVGLAAADDAAQPAARVELDVIALECRQFRAPREEVIPNREEGAIADAHEVVGLCGYGAQEEVPINPPGLARSDGLGALYAPDREAVGLRLRDVRVPEQSIDAPDGAGAPAQRGEGVAVLDALEVVDERRLPQRERRHAGAETPVDKLAGVAMVGANGIRRVGALELFKGRIDRVYIKRHMTQFTPSWAICQ